MRKQRAASRIVGDLLSTDEANVELTAGSTPITTKSSMLDPITWFAALLRGSQAFASWHRTRSRYAHLARGRRIDLDRGDLERSVGTRARPSRSRELVAQSTPLTIDHREGAGTADPGPRLRVVHRGLQRRQLRGRGARCDGALAVHEEPGVAAGRDRLAGPVRVTSRGTAAPRRRVRRRLSRAG